jgi:hypothetical protein
MDFGVMIAPTIRMTWFSGDQAVEHTSMVMEGK